MSWEEVTEMLEGMRRGVDSVSSGIAIRVWVLVRSRIVHEGMMVLLAGLRWERFEHHYLGMLIGWRLPSDNGLGVLPVRYISI